MNPVALRKAIRLAQVVGHVFIATADSAGWPHVATAGRLGLQGDGHVAVTEWFCPRTLSNLDVNGRVSVVVWDPAADTGYQLLAELESVTDRGILDGYQVDADGRTPLPQVERQLLLHVDRVMEFRRAPHTDAEE